MRRGDAETVALSVSPQLVALKQLRDDLSNTHWPTEFLGDPTVSSVNPKIDISQLESESIVSFIPMEAVEERMNKATPFDRPLADVKKGYTAFANDDLLWAKITPCMQNGKSVLVHGLTNGVGFGSTEFHVIRANERVLNGYLWALLSMPRLLYAAQAAFTGSSGHQRVPASFIETLKIPVPPLDVQRRLVAGLEAARVERDRALAEAERLLSSFEPWAIKEMGLSVPKEDVRKVYAIRVNAKPTRIDPFYHAPEFVEIERVVQTAPHAQLGSLVQFSNDTWNSKEHPESIFRYIEISGVDRRRGQAKASEVSIVDAPSRARMTVEPDDIIVSLTRPHHGSIALLNDSHEGCIASTGFAVIRNVDEIRLSRTFLWAVLRLSLSLRQMLRRASGGNYPAITQDELANVLIPLPDKSTQQKIVEEVVLRNNEADRLEAYAETIWREARERFEQQLLQGG